MPSTALCMALVVGWGVPPIMLACLSLFQKYFVKGITVDRLRVMVDHIEKALSN